MQFDYDMVKKLEEPVAELFHMEGSPDEVCLNIYHKDRSKVTTLYYDGEVFSQDAFPAGLDSIKKLYKGDKITITF
jgi:hypothetical protein